MAMIFIAINMAMLLYEAYFCNFSYMSNQISTYNLSIFRLLIYGIILIILYLSEKRMRPYVEKFIESEYKAFLTMTFFILLIIFTLVVVFYGKITLVYTLLIITLLLTVVSIVFITGDYKKDAVVIILLLGLILTFIIPINNQLDEKRHFLTSYNLSYGNIDFIENPLTNEKFQEIKINTKLYDFNRYFGEEYEDRFIEDFKTEDVTQLPANYNIVQYIPTAIGIFIARISGGSIADIYYAGRIFNLITYAGIIYFALKILPYKRKTFFVISLMPMMVALSGVYSIDGVTTGICLLFISYCFKLYEGKDKITLKQLMVLSALFVLVSLVKSAGYIFIGLIVLILPIRKIIKENKKWHIALLALFIIIGVAINAYVMLSLQTDDFSDTRMEGTNATEQLEYIKENPKEFAEILYKDIKSMTTGFGTISYLHGPMFFGSNSSNIFFLLLLYIFFVASTDNTKQFNNWIRLLFIIIFIITIAFTEIIMYISYTPVGHDSIYGYQARYLYPILPLLFSALSSKNVEHIKDESRGGY